MTRDSLLVLAALVALGCSSTSRTQPLSPDAGVDAGAGADVGAGADGGTGADAKAGGFVRCIADWPAAGRAPRLKQSLPATAPTALWSVSIPTSQTIYPGGLGGEYGLVLATGGVVYSTGSPSLTLIDRKGAVSTFGRGVMGALDRASPATVDAEGNAYTVAASGVYSFDPSGKLRWRQATGNVTGVESPTFEAPALSPDGVLYSVSADGVLQAARTTDGQRIWSQPVNLRVGGSPPSVLGGAGTAVFMRAWANGVHAYDAHVGTDLGGLWTDAGQAPGTGVGQWALAWDFPISLGAAFVFDACGRERWSTWADRVHPEVSGVIAYGERLVSMRWPIDSLGKRTGPDQMSLFSADGAVVAGPTSGEGAPLLAGADGTIYTVKCEPTSQPTTIQIIAYTTGLGELWRHSLPSTAGCPVGSGVLDDDGVLYLARALNRGGVEVVAIQTRSPGLAESSWPNLRHDNRGTSWLTPLPLVTQADDGGAQVDADVDAPAID